MSVSMMTGIRVGDDGALDAAQAGVPGIDRALRRTPASRAVAASRGAYACRPLRSLFAHEITVQRIFQIARRHRKLLASRSPNRQYSLELFLEEAAESSTLRARNDDNSWLDVTPAGADGVSS